MPLGSAHPAHRYLRGISPLPTGISNIERERPCATDIPVAELKSPVAIYKPLAGKPKRPADICNKGAVSRQHLREVAGMECSVMPHAPPRWMPPGIGGAPYPEGVAKAILRRLQTPRPEGVVSHSETGSPEGRRHGAQRNAAYPAGVDAARHRGCTVSGRVAIATLPDTALSHNAARHAPKAADGSQLQQSPCQGKRPATPCGPPHPSEKPHPAPAQHR